MKHPMRDTELGGSSTDGSSASDYRLREVEARLERRMAAVEARRAGSSWGVRLLGIGLVLTLAALVVVLSGVLPRDATWNVDSVSAEMILLRDGDGIERGRLATDPDGRAELSLSDREGRERIRLTVLADGSPGVTISDADARPRVVLGSLSDGTTNLVVADAQGTSRAVFGVEPNGSAQALFADRTGAIRTLVGVDAEGAPTVSTFQPEDGLERPTP